ncbi:MAG: acyl-CoA synthetase FdrA [Alkalibacterium sp.]|nr:acyl-CoA synthetase FdrA [Alkalibacterium sp.]
MTIKVLIEKNAYHDSVTLMSLSGKVMAKEGVIEAVVSMATEMNKELLNNIGLVTEESQSATENDLIIAVKAENEQVIEDVFTFVDEELNAKKSGKNKKGNQAVTTFNAALNALPEANLAVISVPGEYAAREARLALNKGLNVMLFSDNVSLEDEKELKEMAVEKNLLVMGPDCGTAMINNTGLCFANSVKKGGIGLVAASGTGLQEVAVQIDRMGYGVTHAIGTGGRDLSEAIGGIMMLEGLKRLEADENTKVITLISKPPAKSVQEKILHQVKESTKPVVVCFLDGDKDEVEASGARFASNLIDAAKLSIKALDQSAVFNDDTNEHVTAQINEDISKLSDSQQFIKGLFCGGTLTAEALSVLRDKVGAVKSNVAKKAEEVLSDTSLSDTHILLDMGDDEFTKGRPHPMIEPNLRNERIIKEAENPNTAVLLLDFELGYGAHIDPVGESIDTLSEAKNSAEKNGRHLSIVAYICGTAKDKQGLSEQENKLRNAGVIVAQSNAEASVIAASITDREVN